MSSPQHTALAEGRWREFSLADQLGNVGSEVSRAIRSRERDDRFQAACTRAFELLDLTLADPRWVGRRRELARVREVFADAMFGGEVYGTTLEDLDKYFYQFALMARTRAKRA